MTSLTLFPIWRGTLPKVNNFEPNAAKYAKLTSVWISRSFICQLESDIVGSDEK